MPVQVYNDVSSNVIQIIRDSSKLIVHKCQIRTIDTLQGDTVRIDIGEGALHHVYVKYSEVTEPATADVNALRDAIKAMLMQEVTIKGGGAGGGDASASYQLEQLEVMNDMVTLLNGIKNISLWSSPSRIDESVPNIVYYGYADPGVKPEARMWAIRRVVREGDLFSYEWANGEQSFINSWDSRYSLTYARLTTP